MTSEPTIELGEDWTLPEEPPRERRGLTRSARNAVIGVALALAVGLLGGSGRPSEPAVSLVNLIPRPDSLAFGQQIMLEGPLLIARHNVGITAYDLNGRRLWSNSNAYYNAQYVESGYVLLVTELSDRSIAGRSGGSREYMTPSLMTALDPLTGARLWQVDTFVEPVGDLLAGDDNQGRLRVYRGNPPTLLWQTEPLRASGLDTARLTAFVLTQDNTLVEYELVTGKVIRSRKVAAPPGDGWLILTVVDDRIFLASPRGGDEELRVLDRKNFADVSWATPSGGIADCGPVICVRDWEQPWQTGAVDKLTGELLWSKDGRRLIVTAAGLLAVDPRDGWSLAIGLLDPMTGAVREPLAGWRAAGETWNEAGVLINTHTDRSEVAVLEPGGLRVIGTVPYPLEWCQHQDGLLVCDLGNGDLGIWRLNP